MTGDPQFWHWLILAVGLVLLEIFVPGTFFLWMGLSAAVVGAVLYLAPSLSWEFQLLIFAVLSIVSIIVWRAWFRKHPPESDNPLLNQRDQQYVGQTVTLDSPIEHGKGRIRLGDTWWKAEGPDAPAGTVMKVIAVNNGVMRLEIVA